MSWRQFRVIAAVFIVGLFIGTSVVPAIRIKEMRISDSNELKLSNEYKGLVQGYSNKISTINNRPDFTMNTQMDQNETIKQILSNLRPVSIAGEEWDILVPTLCPTIQLAVELVSLGYGKKIFVKSGVYKENIVIHGEYCTSLILQGEDKDSTRIIGENSKQVIGVGDLANEVIISGFTISGGGSDYPGVYLLSDSNVVRDNIIQDNLYGIQCIESNGNIIELNDLTDNNIGLKIDRYSKACNVSKNTISFNKVDGIVLSNYSTFINIDGNQIADNGQCGIEILDIAKSSIISNNVIEGNKVGVNCRKFSDGSYVYHNIFRENVDNAYDNNIGKWDNGKRGNYWGDYNGTDNDDDGIGDTPYFIKGGQNIDRFPLMNPTVGFFDESSQNDNIKRDSLCQKDLNSFFDPDIVVPDDFFSIQDAINFSQDNDTIFVRAGTYYEHLIIDKAINLVGEKGKSIIDGKGDELGEIEDRYNLNWTNHYRYCSNDSFLYQSFKPSISSISKVKLRLYNHMGFLGNDIFINDYSNCSLKISIRKNINDSDLTSIYYPIENISGSTEGVWVEFDFPDVGINSGEMYYIVWSPIGISDSVNHIGWKIDEGYDDFCFITYGLDFLPTDKHVIIVNAANVSISDFVIKNSGFGFSGIRCYRDYCCFQNNTIESCGGGIEIWETNNCKIKNNVMKRNLWGVYVHHSTILNIYNNFIFNNEYGLEVGLSSGVFFNNNIEHNSISGNLWILTNNCIFENNYLYNNDNVGLQSFDSNNNIILNNYVSNEFLTSRGISLHHSSKNNLTENFVEDNGYYDISLWYNSNNNIIKNNKIISSIYHWSQSNGIFISSCYNDFIINNTLITPDNSNESTNDSEINIWNCAITIFSSDLIKIYENNIVNYGLGTSLRNSENINIINNDYYQNRTRKDFFLKVSGGLILQNCNNIIIKENIFDGWARSIESNLFSLKYGNILNNNITIISNIILNAISGIILCYTSNSTITKNNFLDNTLNSYFRSSIKINWNNNYWSNWPISFPKIIFGEYHITNILLKNLLHIYMLRQVSNQFIEFIISFFDDYLPSWINFDWQPAKEPFNI